MYDEAAIKRWEMHNPRVAVTEIAFPDLEPAKRVLAELGAELRVAAATTPEAILEVAVDADAIFVTYAKITGDMIRQLKRCKIIARTGIGVDNLDIAAATQAGIVVTYVPDYCIDEVSDHALMLLLGLARRIPRAIKSVEAGQWAVKEMAPIHRLRGSVLGLVGFGKIPRLLVPKAQALGLRVLVFDPYVSHEEIESCGAESVGFEELVHSAEFISIHAPLTSETDNLFNADVLSQMKAGAFLINTSRGSIVDLQALIGALDEGRLAGAALDVLPQEPPPQDSPLLGRDNVIVTPHMAWYSDEALVELQTKAATDIALVLSGKAPRYPYNPEVVSG